MLKIKDNVNLKELEKLGFQYDKELLERERYNQERISKLNNVIKEVRECINRYAIENEDYSKIYNDEEKELLEILEEDKKIEKLGRYAEVSGDLACEWSFAEKKLKDKINEIIDHINRGDK